MKNYQCKKCGTLISNESVPSGTGCPGGGSHQWNNLGESGDIRYQCQKCGTLVYNKSIPSSLGCPSGGSHHWNKLR